MKIDAYTRIVLTVIAGCMVYMVAKDLTVLPTAHAEGAAVPVVTDVNIVQVAGRVIPPPTDPRFEAAVPVYNLQ